MRSLRLPLGLALAAMLAACSGATDATNTGTGGTDTGSSSTNDDGTDPDTGSNPADDTSVTPPTDTDVPPSDTGVTPPSDAGGADTVGPPSDGETSGVVRFVAVGDTGKGNTTQSDVAKAIAAKCAKDGCDFVQLLGDNIYDSGVSSTTDAQWTTKFETPYGGISLPFYAVLGNHDYGGNGTGNEFGKGQHQVDYSAKSTKWRMPAKHYHRVEKHVELIGLDTNMQMYGMASGQKTDVAKWIAESKASFKVAFGHHPILSNGPHGNAGTYEGIPFIPVASGQGVKDFMDSTICGKVDFYISGHDHSRQWLKGDCKGTGLIVSGAGASNTDLKGKNEVNFQAASPGFVWIKIEGKSLTAEFIDATGKSEYVKTVTKP